jgi:hypothetical protein
MRDVLVDALIMTAMVGALRTVIVMIMITMLILAIKIKEVVGAEMELTMIVTE